MKKLNLEEEIQLSTKHIADLEEMREEAYESFLEYVREQNEEFPNGNVSFWDSSEYDERINKEEVFLNKLLSEKNKN